MSVSAQNEPCSLTGWCLKNVLNEVQARPMCKKICLTFVKEPPVNSTTIDIKKLPASILVPGIKGWLVQVNSFLQLELLQTVLITTPVPVSSAVISGLLPVPQTWQNWKSSSSFDRNTMYLGSLLTSSYELDRGILPIRCKKEERKSVIWLFSTYQLQYTCTWNVNTSLKTLPINIVKFL